MLMKLLSILVMAGKGIDHWNKLCALFSSWKRPKIESSEAPLEKASRDPVVERAVVPRVLKLNKKVKK